MDMKILSSSLTVAAKHTEVLTDLNRLRHPRGWFEALLKKAEHLPVSDNTLVLICQVSGVSAGVMMIDAAKRCGVFVDPKYRRTGVGTLLMQQAHTMVGSGMKCCPDDETGHAFFVKHKLSLQLDLGGSVFS